MTGEDEALLRLLRVLQARGYQFVTPTPATHARVLKRLDKRRAQDLRDVFGWSLPFDPADLDGEIVDLLGEAEALEETGDGLKSHVRVSSLGEHLFLHSAYPTEAEDAVFFGPDSYRFAALIEAELAGGLTLPPGALVDIGTGSGVGGVVAAPFAPGRPLVLTDVNPEALRFARVNAALAGLDAETVLSDSLDAVRGPIALALANPPYMADEGERAYRDGGGLHGGELSLEMAEAAARRLEPGGRLILYTGAAIVDGRDALRQALERALPGAGCRLSYRELDPDVFGEELERPAYRDVERIAVVAAVAVKEG